MRIAPVPRAARRALLFLLPLLALSACGDDGTGPVENPTGATLRGRVVLFDLGNASIRTFELASLTEPGVTVSVGSKSTETDTDGRYEITDIPTGDQVVTFAKDGVSGTYLLIGIEEGELFELDGVEQVQGEISTSHTGTWVGTGGSIESGSQGQIDLVMVLEKNGNVITGTATGGSPDSSTWSIEGTETGLAMKADFLLLNSLDSCATGGELTGAFDADTLSGTFIEVDVPEGCGPEPESGTFRVVKQ
jgi:hypothetical protein